MTDQHTTPIAARIDPELSEALGTMPRMTNGKLLDLSDIPALQQQFAAMGVMLEDALEADPAVVEMPFELRRTDDSLLANRVLRPAGSTAAVPALLWFHAGGQVMGSGREDTAYLRRLVTELGCAIVSVDYRLAPQTPAPGAAEDAVLTYERLLEQASDFGIDTARIGIAGASGGGAIAAALALLLRDRGLPTPLLLSLLYPMLDDRAETDSSREIVDLGIWDRRENELAWQAVLGDAAGTADVSPYSAPGRATDLRGLPTLFLAVGQYDLFRDEDIDFARRAFTAGVATDLHVYAGAFHAFDRFAPASTLAQQFEQTWFARLRTLLHP